MHNAGGIDGLGATGDWALENGVLCAVISDLSREQGFFQQGGTLSDLAHCGRGDDQFLAFHQLVNMSLDDSIPLSTITLSRDNEAVTLRAQGERNDLSLETRYTLDQREPTRLLIHSQLMRRKAGPRVFGLAAALVTANSLRSFLLSSYEPQNSSGFALRPVLQANQEFYTAVPATRNVDVTVLVGERAIDPGISYGLRFMGAFIETPPGKRWSTSHRMAADEYMAISILFTTSFWFENNRFLRGLVFPGFVGPAWLGNGHELGWLHLPQARFSNLEVGDTLHATWELWVGERADVASVTNQIFRDHTRVQGHVDDFDASIHIDSETGSPVTHVRPDPQERFEVRLPEGNYRMRVLAPGHRTAQQSFTVRNSGLDLGNVALPNPARVLLPRNKIMRLVFLGENGTLDPVFGDDLLNFTVAGRETFKKTAGVNYVALSGTEIDPSAITVAPGRYRILATRGPEFSMTESRLKIRSGQTLALEIEPPRREFDTPDWISADLHVHSGASNDSALPLDWRIASYIAEGAEVLVSTEHDAVVDYAPRIAALGLEKQLIGIAGVEITSELGGSAVPFTIGHANTFPFIGDPHVHRGGIPNHEGKRWREVISELRSFPGVRVIQLNHPRTQNGKFHVEHFFTHLGIPGKPFDPTKPLDAEPNRILIEPDPNSGIRDIDFDAMELMNGGADDFAYQQSRADWFSLLRQGVILTGTANSDSHTLQRIVAAPRNYIRTPDKEIAQFREEHFVNAIRARKTFGTTGPILNVQLGGAEIGELYQGNEGILSIEVQAASWIPISTATVYVNGVPGNERPIQNRSALQIPLRFERDAFVTVEVAGEASATYQAILPGLHPFAFTNPIFVDADQDGKWSPPAH